MRNGNYAEKNLNGNCLDRSYPTYEEWKPCLRLRSPAGYSLRSYPTYEEWKPIYSMKSSIKEQSSYPTYEEWKLFFLSRL